MTFSLYTRPCGYNHIDRYLEYFTSQQVRLIERYAKSLKGKKILHVNSDPSGGGVAVLLEVLVPLFNSIGIETTWMTIPPDEKFFAITKKIHNQLQGAKDRLRDSEKEYYLNYNKLVARALQNYQFDILMVHDPQPAASVYFLDQIKYKTVLEMHIDLTSPNKEMWNWFGRYLLKYDQYIVSAYEYVQDNLMRNKNLVITPGIDPWNDKNIIMSMERAKNVISRCAISPDKPIIVQISRFDPWKNPKSVIDAFQMAKKTIPELQLVFLAQRSADDPEEISTEKAVRVYADGNPDIHFLVDVKNNNKAVNAFQTAALAVLQLSAREGFGLTVTEAMWKSNVVIGGNATGIKQQIISGRNGFIVNTSNECAGRIIQLFQDKNLKKNIGKNARSTVKQKFLITNVLLHFLKMFELLTSS